MTEIIEFTLTAKEWKHMIMNMLEKEEITINFKNEGKRFRIKKRSSV